MTQTSATPAAAATLLRVDASMRVGNSKTRALADQIEARLAKSAGDAFTVIRRDLARAAPPFVDESWIGANFTPPEERTEAHRRILAGSDALVAELKAAQRVLIASPIYNFGAPAALKAWIDQVARARVTFRYTEKGPVGLLEGKKAYVALASGGTSIDSAIDFATPYLRHVLGFIGITDVTVLAAEKGDMAAAEARLAELFGADAA